MAVKKNESDEGSLPDEMKQLLLPLASKWGDGVLNLESINVQNLSGAMTNAVYEISWAAKTEKITRRVLGRVYGEGVELFFDRDDEIRIFEFLSSIDHGPKLLGKCAEGRIEEFIEAKTLSADDLRDPEISTLIAQKLKEFHSIDMPGTKEVVLWGKLRSWLKKAKSFCTTEHAKEFRLGDFENEISLLEKELSKEPPKIVFCHNDLQYGNIMIKDEARLITFIDYEYASYNPIEYDFANHFCEMAANYHTQTPHILDYSRYPGSDERRRFISSYLNSAGNDPSDEEVKKLADIAEKYTLASHIFWGLWGFISAYKSSIEFDYLAYSRQRFDQYWLRKPELLGISGDHH